MTAGDPNGVRPPTAAVQSATLPGAARSPGAGGNSGRAALLGIAVTTLLVGGMSAAVYSTVAAASERLAHPEARAKPAVAIADHAEAPYCTPQFKEVLERVLHSCGLVSGEARRGCKPTDVQSFAQISGEDFNALFRPLKDRGGVVMYATGKDELDDGAKRLLDDRWVDRKGARYFLVVGRASTVGAAAKNRALSHRRANSILFHLKETTGEPEIEKKVGLLWLGSEFAQLQPEEFCAWRTSQGAPGDGKCDAQAINQSSFVSWVDCRL